MGGGGGFNPISIIGNMIFGSVLGSLAGGAESQRARDAGADTAGAAAELQAAEARRQADRKKAEAALLAKARQADRANRANQGGQHGMSSQTSHAETLGGAAGSPAVGESQLKARLGQ
ncbi:MAG: hypothetical protein Q8O35_13665 [Humidesulfovibrio sp.]|jgi:hypothetical protein|uniref:hypothetical protein n=1 Tax=Humidesulfovibrio sp. TaxID=2910988 RepID=UPI0027332465|nr:hypothetical protein [Humidesulfovibrio sp.]MDP2849217.1 hypothetical protein [Humidesulfovibrio sp.]